MLIDLNDQICQTIKEMAILTLFDMKLLEQPPCKGFDILFENLIWNNFLFVFLFFAQQQFIFILFQPLIIPFFQRVRLAFLGQNRILIIYRLLHFILQYFELLFQKIGTFQSTIILNIVILHPFQYLVRLYEIGIRFYVHVSCMDIFIFFY